MRKITFLLFTFFTILVLSVACSSGDPSESTQGEPAGDGVEEDEKNQDGNDVSIAIVPKSLGNPYFAATEVGAKRAGEELGVDVSYVGSTESDAESQVNVLEDLINKKVDAIAVAPNDPDAVAPVLKKAREAGIKVITFDTDSAEDSREYFVNPVEPEAVGRHMMTTLADLMGEEGEFAIVTGGLTSSNMNVWIDWTKKHLEENYPNMDLLTVVPSDDDLQQAVQVTQDLITGNSEMEGIIAYSSVALPGAAEAVQQAGKNGDIKVIGLTTPNEIREYLKSDAAQVASLWVPEELGYLSIVIANKLLNDEEITDNMEIDGFDSIKVKDDVIIMAEPFDFTVDNVDDYDF